jgi:hypothetical protein
MLACTNSVIEVDLTTVPASVTETKKKGDESLQFCSTDDDLQLRREEER